MGNTFKFQPFFRFWCFFPISMSASVNIKAPYLRVISFLISPSASLYAIASSSVNGSAKVMASTKPIKAARIRPFISETCSLLPNEKSQMIHPYTFVLRRGWACFSESVSTYQDIDLPRQCCFLWHVPALMYLNKTKIAKCNKNITTDIENASSKTYARNSTQNFTSHETLYTLHKFFNISIVSGLSLPNRRFSKEFAGILLLWKYFKLLLIVARCYWWSYFWWTS